jgi:hypothetical protein
MITLISDIKESSIPPLPPLVHIRESNVFQDPGHKRPIVTPTKYECSSAQDLDVEFRGSNGLPHTTWHVLTAGQMTCDNWNDIVIDICADENRPSSC